MSVLNKKIARDIWLNKSLFITIFLMIFMAVFAFAGVHSYMDGMVSSSNEYYENQNLEDLWITANEISDEDFKSLKKIDGVNDVERYFRINATVLNPERYINPTDNKPLTDLTLECNFIESNNINKMYILDGEEFSQDKDGLWLDYYLAENLGINVGDELELSLEGTTFKEKVKGLVETPDHVYFVKDDTAIFPTHSDHGFAYISKNEFPQDYFLVKIAEEYGMKMFSLEEKKEIAKLFISDSMINNLFIMPYAIVDVDDESKIEDIKKHIKDNYEEVVTVTTRDEDISYSGFKREAEEGETYSGVFSGLFVFIAILSVVTTMNRFIRKERTQIGTLKALGIKKRKISLMYISYGFVIAIVASVLGMIIGNEVIGKIFIKLEMDFYEVPYYHTQILPIVYYVTFGIIFVITLTTYLSCAKILNEHAAEALRIERPRVKVKKDSFTTKGVFNKAKLSTKWNIRDMSRAKGRSLMALFGIAGCTILIITAIGMNDSIESYLKWEFGVINNYKYKIALAEDYTEMQLQDIKNKYGNATSQTLGVEFKDKTKEENIIMKSMTINDADGLLCLTDHNKNVMELKDDGIYVTEKLGTLYNLGVGDYIEWRIVGTNRWYTSKIVGLNRDPQSQQLNCTKKFYDSIRDDYKADSLYTNEDLSDVKEIPGVSTIQSIKSLEDGVNSMLGMMYALIALLIIISFVLACVIIYNLGVLSFGEKEYQFATLKVLGFKYKAIKDIFIKQNIWISIIAILISIPLGYAMTDYIFKNAIGDTYDFSADIKIQTYVLASALTFVVSYIVNQFLARKIKKIDMVSSLKGNE